jgi:hypothetical protein
MSRRLLISCLALTLLAPAAIYAADTVEADAVVQWNANAGDASVAACFTGGYAPMEARM